MVCRVPRSRVNVDDSGSSDDLAEARFPTPGHNGVFLWVAAKAGVYQ
jgi:hypothetical protein